MILSSFRYAFIVCIAVLLPILHSCTDSSTLDNPCQVDYDQTEIFRQLADAFIIPGYIILDDHLNSLHTSAQSFVQSPTVDELQILRSAFEAAWVQWQYSDPFNFGPAEKVDLRTSLNPFPANLQQIDNHLSSGNWSLDQPMTYDKGFPALDYLLYGQADSPEGIVNFFQQQPNAGKFLMENTEWMSQKVKVVLEEWETTYRAGFLTNTGTAAGTSLSLIINSLNEHYETVKREKLGIPLGIQTLGIPYPDRVEAPFSALSLSLLQSALEASESTFRGLTGQGLDDYLDAAGAEKNGVPLSLAIKQQYQLVRQAAGTLQPPLRMAITESTEATSQVYEALTRLIPLIKTDMPSALCVSITYIDNPSDSD